MTVAPRARRRGAALRTGVVVATVRLLIGGVAIAMPGDVSPITAEVEAANHAPVATDDKASVDSGATIEDRAPGLLFNDVDADGDPLIAISQDPPTHGTAIVRRDGSWTYTPDPTFAGTDRFTYVVSDGFLTSMPATVLITVRGPAVASPSAMPSPTPSPVPSPTSSPAPSSSPTTGLVPAASPPTGPAADVAFWIPEGASRGVITGDLGLEASAVAGLGPVVWIAPTLLLGVPGSALILVMLGRAARRAGRIRGGRPGSTQAGTARS